MQAFRRGFYASIHPSIPLPRLQISKCRNKSAILFADGFPRESSIHEFKLARRIPCFIWRASIANVDEDLEVIWETDNFSHGIDL
jgi:hypothetical protein